MANSLMNFLSGMGGGSGGIFMKAVGAFMRGESPQDFMKNLARTNPSLGGIDLSNLNGEAERICRERGIDPDKLTERVKATISGMK